MKKRFFCAAILSCCLEAHATSLTEALVSAYNTNPDLIAQRESLKVKDEEIYKAISLYLPNISFVNQSTRTQQNRDLIQSQNGGSITNVNSADYGKIQNPRDKVMNNNNQFVIKQNIFNGGGSLAQFGQAKSIILAARQELFQVESQILMQAISAYTNVIYCYKNVEISKQSLDYLNQVLNSVNARYKAGVVKKTDVANIEQQVAKAVSDLVTAEGDLQNSLSEYRRVVGIEVADLSNLSPYSKIPATVKEYVELAIKHNLQVQEAKHNLAAAESNVGVKIASFLPTADLQASFSKNSNKFNSYTSPTQKVKSITFSVNVPIYQKGLEYSNKRAATAGATASRQKLKSKIDAARQKSVQVWSLYESSEAAYKAALQQVKTANIALEGMREEFESGIVSITDLLNIQSKFIDAELNLSSKEKERVINSYKILEVMGRLNARELNLPTKYYNPDDNYNITKWKIVGF